MRTCESCRHWKEIFDTATPCHEGKPRQGECKQGPPLAMVMLKETEDGNQEPDGMFCYYPAVPPTFEACDQYSPRFTAGVVFVSAMVNSHA